MNVAHWLARVAAQDPQRPAVYVGIALLHRYGDWAERCARLAAGLRAAGLAPGDRIALFMGNGAAYLDLMWASWWAGLVVVPINAKLHAKEAAWIVEHSGARWVFVADDLSFPSVERCVRADRPEFDALLSSEPAPIEARDADDLAWLFYTSGTTGRPKGVMITQRNLVTMSLCFVADVDAISPADTTVYAAPMSHGAGIYTLPYVMAGASHTVPASGGFDEAELFALARERPGLCLFAAPTMVKRLVDHAQAHALDGAGFKTIVYGGGPMYGADIERAMNLMGPRFVQIYGQGESPMTITALSRAHLMDTAHPHHAERIASVGVAQTGMQIAVVDPTGHAVPSGEIGEVVVQGDAVMAGYWRDAEASARALRGGWLWTGDMGTIDADGFLTLKDRSKDLIISGGSNVYPREVEEVLLLHPAVAEVSVIGAPDAEWGEVVVACIVWRNGLVADAAALDALCLAHIARFKRPKRYRFLAALPKNAYGKVLKTELRATLD